MLYCLLHFVLEDFAMFSIVSFLRAHVQAVHMHTQICKRLHLLRSRLKRQIAITCKFLNVFRQTLWNIVYQAFHKHNEFEVCDVKFNLFAATIKLKNFEQKCFHRWYFFPFFWADTEPCQAVAKKFFTIVSMESLGICLTYLIFQKILGYIIRVVKTLFVVKFNLHPRNREHACLTRDSIQISVIS